MYLIEYVSHILIECFSEHFIFFKSDKRFKSSEGFSTLKMDPFSDRAPKISHDVKAYSKNTTMHGRIQDFIIAGGEPNNLGCRGRGTNK